MKRKWTLGLLMALPFAAMSQGFQVNLQGQKNSGMGGAGAGLALDPAAVFYNPGAVATLKENGVVGGVNLTMAKVAFQETGSKIVYNNDSKLSTPFNAYAVWGPKDAKWKLGLGVYTPFGSIMSYPKDWAGRYSLTSLQLQSIFVQPTVSYKVNDFISLGAGFVYCNGAVNLQKALPFSGYDDGHITLKGSNGHGYGYNAGVLFTFTEKLTIGVSYRSKVVTKIKDGDVSYENVPTTYYALGAFTKDGTKFTAELPLPATLAVGFGYKHSDKTLFTYEIDRVFWSAYQSLDFTYNKGVGGATVLSSSAPRKYQDIFIFRLGMQQQCHPMFTYRLGALWGFSPIQNGYVSPETPDNNRYGVTGGFTLQVGKLGIDGSFMFQRMLKRTQTSTEGLSGSYVTNAFIPGLSLSYKL